MVATSLRTLSILFSLIKQLFDSFIEYRQLRKNRSCEFPSHLVGFTDADTFHKARLYNKDKREFSLISDWCNLFINLYILVKVDPWLWRSVAGQNVTYSTIKFLIYSNLISTVVSIPWRLYRDFVIEAKHGFNKKTVGLFFSDLVKGELISASLTSVVVFIVERIHEIFGTEKVHVYLWVTVQIFVVAFMYIYPAVIQPMFNKYTPLKNEKLKKAIDELAKEHKFPLTQVYEVDGSKRSSHSNAYFYGFAGNKRIVLFDTLLTLSEAEVIAVLCHEIGHWFHGHLLKNLVTVSIHVFVMFYLFQIFVVRFGVKLVTDFAVGFIQDGADNFHVAFVMSLLLFAKVYAPVDALLEFAMVAVSRRFEFQADAFAVKAGRGKQLAEALKKIQNDNLGEMDPDWLYSAVKYTHPPVFERIAKIEAGDFVLVDDKKRN